MNFEHPYNRWTEKRKKQLVIFGNIAAFLLMLLLLALIFLVSPLFIVLLPLFFVLAQLIDVPSNLRSGQLKRYSYTLLVETKKTTLHLHTVTLFDCLFLKEKLNNAPHSKRWIFADILSGLRNVHQSLNKEETNIQFIEGTTYFLNRESLEKIGFKVEKPSAVQLIILSMNFLTLMVTNYLITGKVKWPAISNTIKFSCSLGTFYRMQPKLEEMQTRLKRIQTD